MVAMIGVRIVEIRLANMKKSWGTGIDLEMWIYIGKSFDCQIVGVLRTWDLKKSRDEAVGCTQDR